jgi:hypothetical protein
MSFRRALTPKQREDAERVLRAELSGDPPPTPARGPVADPLGAGAAEVSRRRATQHRAHDEKTCGCAPSRGWWCPPHWAELSRDERRRRRQAAIRRRRADT